MRNFLIIGIIVLLYACKGGSTSNTTTSNEPALKDGKYEYLFVSEKDSSFLEFEVKGTEVKGNYRFLPEVSDGAVGDITGTLQGTKIKGVMGFTVEGYTAKEDFAIEIQGADLFWMNYEKIDESGFMKNDTTKLVNKNKYTLRKK